MKTRKNLCNKDCFNCLFVDCIEPEENVSKLEMIDARNRDLETRIWKDQAQRKYYKSEHGFMKRKEYNASAAGQERTRRYVTSEKGKAKRKAYYENHKKEINKRRSELLRLNGQTKKSFNLSRSLSESFRKACLANGEKQIAVISRLMEDYVAHSKDGANT